MSEKITLVTVLFASVLAFSLLIERALEVLKATYDLLDSRFDYHKFWTKRTWGLHEYIEHRLHVFTYVDTKGASAIFNRFNEMMLGPQDGYNGTVPTLCGDLVRAVYVRLACKFVGSLLGLWIAFGLRLDVLAAAQQYEFTKITPTPLGMAVTGIAIGLGAGPVHKLIRVVEKKREAITPKAVTNA